METRADTFLSAVDRISRSLGPINNLVAHIVDRMAPQTTALANICPPPGAEVCAVYCVASAVCCGSSDVQDKIVEYATTILGCGGPISKCSAGCSAGCPAC